jgi:hypothetical protein
MNPRIALVVLCLLITSYSRGVRCQSVPVVAKMRLTEQLVQNGKTESHTREGVYYRNAAGSVLEQWTSFDGKPTVGQMSWATLYDRQTGTNYMLDYVQHHAYVDAPGETSIPKSSRTRAQNVLGQGSIQGLACTWYPTNQLNATGEKVPAGKHCYSDTYELDLKEDNNFTWPMKDSVRTQHLVIEKYDIQMGQEPDSKLFDVKSNFVVFSPEPKQ